MKCGKQTESAFLKEFFAMLMICMYNADDLYVPGHHVEFVKRLPIIALPTAWNSAPGNKTNPVKHLYLKELKSLLLAAVPL
jgi:hypothetical protein